MNIKHKKVFAPDGSMGQPDVREVTRQELEKFALVCRFNNLKNLTLKKYFKSDYISLPTDLSKANLSGANLAEAYLVGVNFSSANLRNTNLESANLKGANLESAILVDASLVRADLRNSNLKYANLKGANLNRAIVEGVDTREIKSLHDAFNTNTLITSVMEENARRRSQGAKDGRDVMAIRNSSLEPEARLDAFLDLFNPKANKSDPERYNKDYEFPGPGIRMHSVELENLIEKLKNQDIPSNDDIKELSSEFAKELEFSKDLEAIIQTLQSAGNEPPKGKTVQQQSPNQASKGRGS